MRTIRILISAFIIILLFSATNMSAQNSRPLIRFGLVADIQYADCKPGGSRFYRNSLDKIDSCVRHLNDRKVDFTINLGDVTDKDWNELDAVLPHLRLLDNKLYNTTGNHDYKGVTDNKALYKRLDMPSEYYFFTKKNWVFVMLNTNEIAPYANVAGTDREQELSAMYARIKSIGDKQGASWNGGISQDQLRWLDKLLAKSEKGGRNVLLFTHHPLYPPTGFSALNDREILDVIGHYSCVRAIFSGHHHAGGFAHFKNIPAVTAEGMIETEHQNSFGIVSIYTDKIVLEGKGRMTSRVFEL